MEILQYLRAAGRWAWLLVLVPTVLGAAGWFASGLRPAQYTATTTVYVDTASTDANPAVVRQAVDTFSALSRTDEVLGEVAEVAGTDGGPQGLRDGLTVAGQGSSNLVDITWVGPSAEQAETVTLEVAQRALDLGRSTALEIATQDVEAFQNAYDQATGEFADFAASTGTVLPEEAYQSALSEIAATQRGIDEATRLGQPSATLAARQDQLQEGLAGLRDAALQGRLLQQAVDRASGQLASAQARRLQTEVRTAEAGDEGRTVFAGDATRVDPTSFRVQIVAGAVVVGLMLAAGVLVAREVGLRSRAARAAAPTAGGEPSATDSAVRRPRTTRPEGEQTGGGPVSGSRQLTGARDSEPDSGAPEGGKWAPNAPGPGERGAGGQTAAAGSA